jgi:outer membrane protein TolC
MMKVSSWVTLLGLIALTVAVAMSSAGAEQGGRDHEQSHFLPANGAGGTRLSFSDYLGMILERNPALQASVHVWASAQEKPKAVSSLPDPQLGFRYYVQEVETRVGPQKQALGLTQRFPWKGKRKLAGKLAGASAKQAGEHHEALRRRLFEEFKQGFAEYFYIHKAIELVRMESELLKELESVVTIRYMAGSAGYTEMLRIQVEMDRLEDRVKSLKDLARPVLAALNAILDRPPVTQVELPETLASWIPERQVAASDAWLTNVDENNPELRAITFQAEEAAQAVSLARKNFFPDVTVGVEWINTGSSAMPNVEDNGKDPIILTFGVNLPVWRGKYRAEAAMAEQKRMAAMRQREDEENRLVAELEMVLYGYHDGLRKIALYRETIIPKARESLEVTRKAFESNESEYLDLIDVERTLFEFELAYVRAVADTVKALASAERITGEALLLTGE